MAGQDETKTVLLGQEPTKSHHWCQFVQRRRIKGHANTSKGQRYLLLVSLRPLRSQQGHNTTCPRIDPKMRPKNQRQHGVLAAKAEVQRLLDANVGGANAPPQI